MILNDLKIDLIIRETLQSLGEFQSLAEFDSFFGVEFTQNGHVCISLFAGQHFVVRIDELRVSTVSLLNFRLLLGGFYIFALKFPLWTKL